MYMCVFGELVILLFCYIILHIVCVVEYIDIMNGWIIVLVIILIVGMSRSEGWCNPITGIGETVKQCIPGSVGSSNCIENEKTPVQCTRQFIPTKWQQPIKIAGPLTIQDALHGRYLAHDPGNGAARHLEDPTNPNAWWWITETGPNTDEFYIESVSQPGYRITAGVVANNQVYHQNYDWGTQSVWSFPQRTDYSSNDPNYTGYYIKDKKHGRYIASNTQANGYLAHQSNQTDRSTHWNFKLVPGTSYAHPEINRTASWESGQSYVQHNCIIQDPTTQKYLRSVDYQLGTSDALDNSSTWQLDGPIVQCTLINLEGEAVGGSAQRLVVQEVGVNTYTIWNGVDLWVGPGGFTSQKHTWIIKFV
jgi:hypothetical protein